MSISVALRYKGKLYPDASVGIEVFRGDFDQAVRKIPKTLQIQLGRLLHNVAQQMVQKHSTSYSGIKEGGAALKRRSGKALRSIMQSVSSEAGSTIESVHGSIGGIGYLSIHEYGGTVTAKRAKYLTIPTEHALDSKGNPLKPRARDWKDTFIARSKAGNLIIFQNQGAGKKPIPLYVLKRSVQIKPRLGMRKALERGSDKMIRDIMREVDRLFK